MWEVYLTRHEQWIRLDLLKREIYIKSEIKKKLLRSIKNSRQATLSQRYLASFYLSRLARLGTSTAFNNRCVESGRVWSVTRYTNQSRFVTRQELYKSNLPGFKRASW